MTASQEPQLHLIMNQSIITPTEESDQEEIITRVPGVFSSNAFPRLGNAKKINVIKKRPSYSEAVQADCSNDDSKTPLVRYNRAKPRNIDFGSFVPRRVDTRPRDPADVRPDHDIAISPKPDLISYNDIRSMRILPGYKIDGAHSAMGSLERGIPKKYKPKQSPKIRNSVGVALFRRNAKTNRVQILLVRKRSTYAFHTFVHSQYRSDDNHAISALFNKMTAEEKLDILSLNFNQLWYRIWLNTPFRTAFYYMCKHKFENTFLRDDGKRLNALIARSTCGELIWEIPKGRRSRGESVIDCAIREFQEETNIPKDHYRIVFMPDRGEGPTRSFTHQDEGTVYTNTYYMAVQKTNIKTNIDFRNESQIVEIGEIRWMDIDDIAKIDWNNLLVPFVRPLMQYMKRHV